MEEEWISLKEFMKRRKIGYETAIQLINNKEVEAIKSDSGRYKIKIGGNSISKEIYDETLKRAIEAETRLKIIQEIIGKEELR